MTDSLCMTCIIRRFFRYKWLLFDHDLCVSCAMGHSAEMESLGSKAAKDEMLHARVTKVHTCTEPKEIETLHVARRISAC